MLSRTLFTSGVRASEVRMKKKRIVILSLILAAVIACLVVGIVLIFVDIGGHTHRFGDWKVVRAASCMEAGLEERSCKCGESEKRRIQRLGHRFGEDNVCTVCSKRLIPTEQLGYSLSADGKSYTVSLGLAKDAEEIVIPLYKDGIKVTAVSGFEGANMKSVFLPDGLETVALHAFDDCKKLESCSMSITTKEIANFAFMDCEKLKEIEIPPTATIGQYAFRGCSSLTSLNIPETVTTVGYGAFADCTALNEVILGGGIKELPASMFENCTSLVYFNFVKVTAVGANAFKGCKSLKELVFYKDLTTLGATSFQDCAALSKITYSGTKSEWKAVTDRAAPDWLANIDPVKGNFRVYCSDGVVNRYNIEIDVG